MPSSDVFANTLKVVLADVPLYREGDKFQFIYAVREHSLMMLLGSMNAGERLAAFQLETVSRTFSAFQQQGLLEVDKRHIRIVEIDRLSRSSELRVH